MSHSEHEESTSENPYAFDDTPAQSKAIAIWSVVSVVGLLLLIPVFHSYFNAMFAAEHERKVSGLDDDNSGEADYIEQARNSGDEARQRLASAPTNIESAMQMLSERGRNIAAVRPERNDGVGASISDAIATLAAVEGWGQRKRETERNNAEAALLAHRAQEIVSRLMAAKQQAEIAKNTQDVEAAERHAGRLRAASTIANLEPAEAWLLEFSRRAAGAATAVGNTIQPIGAGAQ